MNAPLIVAGMHRSGTSVVASFLSAFGVDMGEFIAPEDRNPEGYSEDLRFQDLNRRILDAAMPNQKGGYWDLGLAENQVFNRNRLSEFREEARTLVETRSKADRPWGWTDPRAILLLDFWNAVIDDFGIGPARYVFLYRCPWNWSDSIQCLGSDVFLTHPKRGFRIWTDYNRQLLNFCRGHRENVGLVCIEALVRQPECFVSLVKSKFGLALRDAALDEFHETTFPPSVSGSDPLISLLAATESESVDLLSEMDREADISCSGLWAAASYRTQLLRPDRRGLTPDISIVIACHNDGYFLAEAVASVERACPESCELIIVNDGSKNGDTLRILDVLREAGHYVIDQENRGTSDARNRGIRKARGRYVLPLDADNRLLPGFTAAAIEALDRIPEVGVVYGDCLEFGMRSGLRNPPDFDLSNLLRGNYIDACAVFRKTAWEDADGYDPSLPAWEDWEFWINVASRGWQFLRLQEVAFEYRVRPVSKVTLTEQPEVHEQIIKHIVAKHADLFQCHIAQGLILWHRDVRARENTAEILREEVRTRDHEASRLRALADVRQQEVTTLQSKLEVYQRQIGSQREKLED